MAKIILLFIFFASVLVSKSLGQRINLTSITSAEVGSMKYKAENIVTKELNDLFNQIANSQNDDDVRKKFIKNSYTVGEKNRIFLNADINVQDDINPTYKSPTNMNDSRLKKYLDDLDLLYGKSNENSIIFSNAKTSFPKQGVDTSTYIYVNVYFNSLFRNTHSQIGEIYTRNYRVADVRLVKENGKWRPFIQSISFFEPKDTLTNFYLNDISIVNPEGLQGADSATIAAKEREIMAEEERKEREKDNEKRRAFMELIGKGDKLLEINDISASLQFYNEAKEQFPMDPLARIKIRNALRRQSENTLSKERIAEGYLRDAGNEEKKRNYQQASKLYNKAISENPDIKDKYVSKIRELDEKWLIVLEIEDKLEAGTVDYKNLVDQCSKAIKKNTSNSDLYLERAKCYRKLENLNKAIDDCTLAIQYDKDNLPALKLKAELLRNRNEKQDNFSALSSYKSYLNIYDEDSSIYENMSDLWLAIKPNDFDKAIEFLDNGVAKNPKWAHLYYKKGLLLVQKNDIQGGKKSFSLALANDSFYAFSYFERGKVELSLKNVSNAALDFDDARRKGLDSASLKIIDNFAQKFYEQASDKFFKQDTLGAIKSIDQAIAISPKKSEYHFRRGEYLITLGKNDEAIASLSRAIELNDNLTEAWFKRGEAYFNKSDYKTASENFSTATKQESKHLPSLKGLGDSYFALKNNAGAAQTYETFIQVANAAKNSTDASTMSQVYNSLGKSYFLISEADEKALNAFKNAIKKNPAYAEAYFNKGLYHHKKNDLNDAIEDLIKSVNIENKNAAWDYELAQTYRDKADFGNARISYTNTLVIDNQKSYPQALYLSGNCSYQLNDYNAALPVYQKVQLAGLDGMIQSFNYELGNIYLNLNKTDSAIIYIQKASLVDSTNGKVIYASAVAQLQKGNQAEALRLFDNALKTGKISKQQIKNDKLVANFKDDKNFKQLIKKYF